MQAKEKAKSRLLSLLYNDSSDDVDDEILQDNINGIPGLDPPLE